MSFDWNEDRLTALRRMFDEKRSGSEIGEVFGISRNAVIGKLNRLGLTRGIRKHPGAALITRRERRVPTPHGARTKAQRIQQAAVHRQRSLDDLADAMEATDLPAEQSSEAVTFAELAAHHCRWPLGDPATPEFMFCGAGKFEGSSYCARHHRMAYKKTQIISDEERARRRSQGRKNVERWKAANGAAA